MKRLTLLLIPFVLLSGLKPIQTKVNNPRKPLNIILMIGDGMGLSQMSASFYFNPSTSAFGDFTHIGLVNTSSATHKVTDSGAGGTAIACGKRTYNYAIGVGLDSLPLQNITEILSKRNYKSGIVVTCGITHATPASFYAHAINRSENSKIAEQLLQSKIDFFAGGGLKYFTARKDGKNLFKEFMQNGFTMDSVSLISPKELKSDKKYGFLLASDELPKARKNRGNFLPEATVLALNYLSQSNNGFFLMVEGSQIDWGGHDNDDKDLIAEVIDFDNAVRAALEFAKNEGNTLVIVTADHETGGFTLAAKDADKMDGDYDKINPKFATNGHSATLVPLLAYGPQANNFIGLYKNEQILEKILSSIKMQNN